MNRLNIISTTFVLLCLSFHCGANQTEITIAVEDSAPPYSNKLGQGYSFNLLKAIFKDSPYTIKTMSVPYARALQMLESGHVIGALHVTKDANSARKFVFGEEPFITLDAYLYYANDSTQNFNSISEIPVTTQVGVTIDFEYGAEFEAHKRRLNVIQVSDQKQLIGMLKRGRIDVAIMYDDIANYKLAELKLPISSVKRGVLVSSSEAYLALDKSNGESAKLIAWVDKRLVELKQTHTYKQYFK